MVPFNKKCTRINISNNKKKVGLCNEKTLVSSYNALTVSIIVSIIRIVSVINYFEYIRRAQKNG